MLQIIIRVRQVKIQSHVVVLITIFSTLFDPLNPMVPLEFRVSVKLSILTTLVFQAVHNFVRMGSFYDKVVKIAIILSTWNDRE